MTDKKQVMSWLEGLTFDDWYMYHSDSEVQECAKSALSLLKEQGTEWEHLWDAPDGTFKGRCKKCGFVHFFIEGHDTQYKFCPECGKAVNGEHG
jgi:rubrerythrin